MRSVSGVMVCLSGLAGGAVAETAEAVSAGRVLTTSEKSVEGGAVVPAIAQLVGGEFLVDLSILVHDGAVDGFAVGFEDESGASLPDLKFAVDDGQGLAVVGGGVAVTDHVAAALVAFHV